jgi:protein translocase SecG subunit
MLTLIHIIISIILIFLILLQQRGSEGGAIFGTQSYFFFKKRGLEKILTYLTWVFIIFFIIISLLKIIYS